MECKLEIYKDGWIESRPWYADLTLPDGHVMKAWCSKFKTKKGLLAHVASVDKQGQWEITMKNGGKV